ncbi:MAG: flagellar assembly protein FliW, partial [Planctomycetes bacterium]|nr:flagellar assembly protein FliW [Planctomycetota bacterium]
MIIETSRFGHLEVDEKRLITFDEGILGFPDQHRYALIQTGEGSGFYWLQAVDEADLAFVVCDPRLFVADYRVPVKAEDLATIELDDADK